MGIKGKKRKRDPKEFLLPVTDGFTEDKSLAIGVEKEDHPSLLSIPRLRPLSLLGNSQQFLVLDGHPVPMDIWRLTPDWDERVQRLKQQGIEKPFGYKQVEITPYFKLLAKIAHCCAIGAAGYDGFEHMLIPGIRDDPKLLDDLVGELPAFTPSLFPFDYRKGLHEVAVGVMDDHPDKLFVHIRLLSNLMRWPQSPPFTPTYAVIAGRLTSEQRKKIALKSQSFNAR